jgi:hypothetical protein
VAEAVKAKEFAGQATAKKHTVAAAAGSARKKRKTYEEGIAKCAGDDEAIREFEETVRKKEHKSAALSARKRTKKKAGLRSRKLVIYPHNVQKAILSDWLEATRMTKNVIIGVINETHVYDSEQLRKAVNLVENGAYREHLPRRLHGVPRDVIDQAVRDCVKDCTSRLAQLEVATRKRIYREHFKTMRNCGDDELRPGEREFIEARIAAEVERDRGVWRFAFNSKWDDRESMMLSNRFLNSVKPRPENRDFATLFGGPSKRTAMETEADPRDKVTGACIASGLPRMFYSDCRLVHEKAAGKYHLCVPEAMPVHSMAPRPEVPTVISIDPGVRTFATCYNPAIGAFTEHGKSGPGQAFGLETRTTERRRGFTSRTWGVGASIAFLARKARRVAARAAADRREASAARRKSAKREGTECEHRAAVRRRRKFSRKATRKQRAAARIRKRSRDIVAAMHWRLAIELCQTADVILLPDFKPSEKVAKIGPTGKPRKLSKTTVTKMRGQAHATFKERLLSKAEEYGVRVEIVREDFTSKTCGRCGRIFDDLGSNHAYKCPTCRWGEDPKYPIGRDENGARNVFLRYIADTGLHID